MAAHLTLLITAAGDGELQLLVQRGDASGLGPGVWQGRHRYDAAAAQAELDALTRAARRALTRPGLDAVVAHGRLLFDLVLPAPVKAALRDPEGGTLLVAAGPLAHLPWPLLHDGAAPLGLRWALGEIVEGEAGLRPTTGRTGDRLLVVADPAGDLPAARFEGEALMRALAGDGGLACDLRLGRLRRADFLRMFKSFRVIHLAGHADAADETGPAGWRLADGRVDAEALAAVAGASAPQLVFANACQSARAPALVEALLRAGVRQVIGTVVDLPDLPGADFALQVYRGLREGLGVGEALRRARVQAAHADEPVWLAYRLFGDPRTPCFERAVAEVGGAGVRQGVVLAARAPWADADPETLADQAQRWRDAMRQAVQAHGGRLLPGRAAVGRAVFGVPISHENDAWRAARAALELADQAPAGTVLVLEAGPLTSTGADVLGHAVLAAEAACWVARPGVTALAGAARRLQGSAHLAADEPGHRVLGLALGAALPTPPLVGRAAELDRLVAGLDGARRRGEAWAATLLGPAGQGKSRLVAAVVERAGEGFLTLRSPSPAYDEVQPFAGIATVLRGLLELGEARGPALRADLAAALGALEAPAADGFLSIDALLAGGERRGLIERLEPLAAVLGLAPSGRAPDPAVVPVALREVVEAVARRQPVLLVFEDVHALPAAALAVVDELVLGPVAGAVAVVCTARPRLLERAPRWGQGPRHLRLDLPPLAPAEAEALLAALLPPDTPPEVRRALAARAEGNPLFARELGLARADGAGDDAVPPTVEAVMTARLDRRTPLEREVLRAAATFGRSFWLAGVERLLGRPQGVAAAVAALAAGGFVIRQAQSELADQEEWRFAHALLQAVVEQGTRQRARRAWHGRAALWLAEEVAGGLAHRARIAAHLEAAGDHQRAAEAWLAAAAQAEAGLAPAEAAQALAAALAADDAAGGTLGAARRAAAEEALAQRRRAEGDLQAADALLAAAIDRDDDPVRRAERLRLQAEVDEARGELGAARVRLATARGLVAGRPAGRTVAVVIERDEAWLAWRDGGSDEAVRRLTALLATLGADEPALLGPVHNALGVVAYGRGAHAEAERHYRLALAAFEALGDLARMSSAYNNLGILAMRQGDYAGAEGWFQRGLRIKAEGGDREGLARAYNNLGTLHGETGDYARAAQFLAESIRIRERSGHAGLAVGYANLGEVFLKQGRFPEARARLRQAIDLCAAGKGPGYLLPDAWRMLAELGLAEGHAEEAAASASEALRLASESGDRPRAGVATRVLGEARAALGDADADAVLAAAVEVLADLEQPLELARAYAARARCWQGDAEAARAWRAEADRLLAAVGARG